MPISKRCQGLGDMLLDVRQDLWFAMENLKVVHPYSFNVAEIWAKGAKRRYDTPFWKDEFNPEEFRRINEPLERGLGLIREQKDIEASFAFEEARKVVHDMMFQKVVACECGDIEEIKGRLMFYESGGRPGED